MNLVVYISGHGFGHASRTIEVINAVLARRPDARVQVRTSAARWLLDLTIRGTVDVAPVSTDPGVAQIDSLRIDLPGTVRSAAAFYEGIAARIESEARALEERGAELVLADIPPLAFAAARLAGVPAVALSNFTWDWIFDGFGERLGRARWLPERMRELQRGALEALRLPMHGGFAGFGRVTDLPLVARRSTREPGEVRDRLGLPASMPVVLVSFGGYGLRDLPLERIAAGAPFVLVTADTDVGRTGSERDVIRSVGPGVRIVGEQALYGTGLRYEDIVAAADVVVSKPGYGIVSECAANGTALLYTSRGPFAEYDVLVREMPAMLRCAFIDQQELREGRWHAHVDRLLQAPGLPRHAANGADVAAERVLALAGDRPASRGQSPRPANGGSEQGPQQNVSS
jgi:hypothetical protein